MARPAPSLNELWQRAQVLIDEKLGVLQHVKLMSNPPGAPAYFRYEAKRNILRDETGAAIYPYPWNGYGFKRSALEARLAAVGEAVERYCSMFTRGHRLIECTYRELPGPGVDPCTVARPSLEQYERVGGVLRPPGHDVPMWWVEGIRLDTGEPWWIPADLVFMVPPGNRLMREPVSTGLAAGWSFWNATYRALCEVVERDSFTIMWLMQIPFPRVDLSTVTDSHVTEALNEFAGMRIRVTVNDLTTDLGIPVFLATGEADWHWPRVWVSSAADLDPMEALRKALDEMVGELAFLMDTKTPIQRVEDIRDMHDHAVYYADGAKNDRLRFYLDAPVRPLNLSGPPPAGDDEAAARAVVERLVARGYDVLAVDLTTPDVAAAGFRVVRAVVPQLQWLHHAVPCLDCPRMWEVARAWGRADAPPNMAVHPFP